MKRFWDKTFSHTVPVKGFSRRDVKGMEDLGMADPPPVVNHLHPGEGQLFLQPEPRCQKIQIQNALAQNFVSKVVKEIGRSPGLTGNI